VIEFDAFPIVVFPSLAPSLIVVTPLILVAPFTLLVVPVTVFVVPVIVTLPVFPIVVFAAPVALIFVVPTTVAPPLHLHFQLLLHCHLHLS